MTDDQNVVPIRKLTAKSMMDVAMEHAENETNEDRIEHLERVSKRLMAMGLMESTVDADHLRITPAGWQALQALMAFATTDRTVFEEHGLAPSTMEEWDSVLEWINIRGHFQTAAEQIMQELIQRNQTPSP